ncbi:Calcium-dependent protein kinase 2 [Gossypium australe]|uniref:Calcium-dependent protein kinase 2 n=1 Tax=Gossypium australe TaxID=47621 RepID=A0A5B6VEJ3_9ROSI|nr:Calcium-dependent protein kinase 2 [Gossypium australe]
MSVHAVEEEMAASSSSKVESVVKEDHGKENGKEDLSNGTNGKTVREDTDGDGDYVFVNGNEAVKGDLVESDLDKNGNGIGVEDQGFESLETKGEVKSKSDLVEKDESCIGIVDQDKESVELCHVEAPVDEQKSGDLVEGGPVSATNAGMADQNGISELSEDVFVDKNIVKHTVSEAAVVDSSARQSDETSPFSGPDGNGSANDSALDFRSKENEGSEIAVADDGDCSGDGLVNDSVEAPVSEADVLDFRSKDNEGSEMAVADDGDCNGDGLANDNAKATVSEASVINSRSKENEGSEITVADDGDCNGDNLANDSAKTTVSEAGIIDSRSKENVGSEMAAADGGDCNANGLSNDSAEATVSEANVIDSGSEEREGFGVALAADGDCNGDGLANDSANATVSETSVIDSWSEEKEGSEMTVAADGDYDGDGLPNDGAKATVSGANVEESEVAVVVNGDCSGDGLANGSAEAAVSEAAVVTRNEHKGVCDDGVPIVSVPDSNGDCFPDVSENDTVSEAILVDSRVEQNDGVPVCVSGSDTVEDTSEVFKPGQNESEADSPGPVSDGDGNGYRPEQNGFSGIAETVLPDVVSGNELVKDGESLTAVDDFPVESGSDLEPNTERDLRLEADIHLEKETGNGSLSDECGEALQDVHTQDGISEAVQIDNSSDSGLNSQQGQSPEFVESINENVHVERVTTNDMVTDSADVAEGSSSKVMLSNNLSIENGVGDTTDKTFPPSSVDDDKLETEGENSRVGLDPCLVENSEIDIKAQSDSIDDKFKSRCVSNDDDSIISKEAEVSKVLVECHSTETDEKLVAVVDVQDDSNSVAAVSNDEKASAPIEQLSADISDNDELVYESRESDCDTNNNEQTCAVIKGGIQFGSVVTGQEPEGVDEVERKSPFYFLIRVPRYDDENLKEKIRLAQIRVDEKTQSRDAIRIEIQKMRAICKKYGDNIDAAISQERAVRDLHRSKRQEIDSIQSMMNIEDIDAQIRNMEHMIQHETMPLKDEKQFIHQIKQFKQTRERISSSMSKQDEVQQGLDQKDQIKERMKSLKKEADQLKVNLLKAEAVTKAAKKEYLEETEKLNKLQSQFKAADDIRQEAYVLLQSLKKQSYEKNKYFYQYRDDAKAANDLALKGDKEALQNLCVSQAEKFMELWNNNDEFRKEYIRCNTRSTLRRLRTLDGRALGPDEEPPVIPAIPKVVNERVAKDQTVSSSTLEERTQEKTAPAKAEIAKAKPAAKSMEQKNVTSKSEKPVKSVPPASGSTTASSRDKIEEAEEKPKITKEEEEMARKAEESRKEEEAAKLREQRRLEEIAKAKEALERKRRNAEKAQARAALRAQKEAEQKEKEREKRAKKKERRKVAAAGVGDASVTDETESALTLETPAETPKDSESKEKLVTVAKRSQKPPQFTKQSKAKSIPPPLRNRGKRKMQQWMWVLVTSLIVLALFLAGNYNFSFNFGLLQKFNF